MGLETSFSSGDMALRHKDADRLVSISFLRGTEDHHRKWRSALKGLTCLGEDYSQCKTSQNAYAKSKCLSLSLPALGCQSSCLLTLGNHLQTLPSLPLCASKIYWKHFSFLLFLETGFCYVAQVALQHSQSYCSPSRVLGLQTTPLGLF
jgi:hypothetical protein